MTGTDLHAARILIVDDEQANIDLLVGCIQDEGYEDFATTRDPEAVAALFQEYGPDLVLLDLHMPRLDGFAVLEQLRRYVSPDEFLPVLVLTADASRATKERALSCGATDFLTKPLGITEVLLRIGNLLHTRQLHVDQRLARRRAEDTERRASLLAEASRVLASSFDHQTTLAMLCRAMVPGIADYCVVDVLQADGTIVRPGFSHVDPAIEPLLRETAHAQPSVLPADHPVVVALREGRRTLAQEITPGMVSAVTGSHEHRQLLARLRPRSLITVPIVASGPILGALVLVYSDSGRRYAAEDLELARELGRRAATTIENAQLFDQAHRATRARDEMLGMVAHDLRNPLSTIMMGSEMLIDSSLDDAQRRFVELVRRAAGRMQELIQDLLEARQIESGQLRVSPQAQPVGPLVAEAVAMLTPLAAGRGIGLRAVLDDGLRPALVDGARLLQVLSNLVGNALKFTPAGGSVEIGCIPLGEELRLVVSDTGPGIPPEQIPHVFGRYWQAAKGDRRGIGLGLSIVRGIVEAHGGRVWVESSVGSGARFYFTVPAQPVGAEAMLADAQPLPLLVVN
ncbi:MAG TPA: ATP-binding protein [Longimicrobium sp.]|jgi:signal transduction histidine kinase/DNA-binding response OmpR family regulator|uniref:hybrid sensor histidine kinase/response regulator n=1 Tax=Longimicrobium sp. TaxID=2029185 RepID=UPI002EDB0A44